MWGSVWIRRDKVFTPERVKSRFISLFHETQELQQAGRLEDLIPKLLSNMKTCDATVIREILLELAFDNFFGCPRWGEHLIMEIPPDLPAINEPIEPMDHGIISRVEFQRVRQCLHLLIPFA
jgi:hypothetical protein